MKSNIRFKDIVTYQNLKRAYDDVRKHKSTKYKVQQFHHNFVTELNQLYSELINGTYHPIPVREFNIWCTAGQKIRKLAAPALRDLIVQKMFYNALYPIFEPGWIFDSYGCRQNKGADKAANRTQDFLRASDKDSYYLQIDVKHYYYNIRKILIKAALERKIKDSRIIDTMLEMMNDLGVNVGSVMAQFFGLIALDKFDHFVKRTLKIKHYIRYVDDAVFIGLSKEQCLNTLKSVNEFLNANGFELSKHKIHRIKDGVNYCGFISTQKSRRVRKRSIKVFNKALKHNNFNGLESCLAHSEHSNTYKFFMKKLFEKSNTCEMPTHIQCRMLNFIAKNQYNYIDISK